KGKIEAVLCTNCQSIIKSFYNVFQDLWNKSSDIKERIYEIESGKPPSIMELIKDPKTAKKKYYNELDQAKNEILIVTSPKRLNEISKNVKMIRKWCKKGVSTKIMAPINYENLKAIPQLLTCTEVRHIPVGYRETTIIDGKKLFQFNKPCPQGIEDCELLNLQNVFFTTDLDYIKNTKNNLFEIWDKTHTPPTQGIEFIVKGRSSNNSDSIQHHSVLEKRGYNIELKHHKIGILSKKDVLTKINKERKITLKQKGKKTETRRYFGQRAFGLITLPKNFSLPNMIIGIFQDDELSATRGQKYMIIDIPQESTSDNTYIPVAYIQNSSELLEFRRKCLVDLPIANNMQVIKEDKFQIQVKGNTMFAGWTIPITLTPKYILPPACILFEGFGKVKSGMFTNNTPINRKYEIWYNSLDAFVTFFLPDYKYVGSGTEGFIDIDSVWINSLEKTN
ncbi:hypothetical protein AC477_01875, partial [miscellaneous Crenarchaeota group-1 archaeon SG8-32-1]